MSISKNGIAASVATAVTLLSTTAFAQETVAKVAEVGSNVNDVRMWGAIGGGIAVGLAVLGGATGQGRAAAAALEGIARNPGAVTRVQTPMILALAFIESLVLFAIVGLLFILGIIGR
jgi:F-type H+-transporting ATPase subunit c